MIQPQLKMIGETTFPDDDELLPPHSVIDGSQASTDLVDSADYVVIGSGAAGATAAYLLSKEGYSVIVLEDGPWIKTRKFTEDVYPAVRNIFRDMGTNMTIGKAVAPVVQARCVGGSTTINSAIVWRVSEKIIDTWNRDYGLGNSITRALLDEHYDALDQDLQVRPVADRFLGNHNSLLMKAAERLKIKAERISRYDGGCRGSASCLTGCRSAKKLSMNVTYIPRALHQGARIYTMTRALSVKTHFGRANQVLAQLQGPGRHLLQVHAKRGVLLAASAVQTPGILKKSGIRLPTIGRFFQAHPGSSLPAFFDQEVSMQFGATQGYNTMHFGESDHFKIEALSLPPEMLALRLPGTGPEFMNRFLKYKHIINWALVVKAEALGSVQSFLGKNFVFYSPTQTDMVRMRKGFKAMSELLFAAGAKEIWPSVHGMPTLKSPDDLKKWDQASLNPRDYGIMMSHLFGSTRMGTDPRSSAVGLDFQVHGVRGLYVLDSSIFPTNIGVNPQHTIMAVSRLGTSRILNHPLPPA